MKYSKIINFDSGNARGLSVVLFVSGCKHCCAGCHNPETWDFNYGEEFTQEVKEDLIRKINNPNIRNFVISGGDPLYHGKEILQLVKEVKEKCNKNIIVYTGFKIEEIRELKDELYFEELSKYIDILVDGPFVMSEVSPILDYRGSVNQRAFSFKDGITDISYDYFKYKGGMNNE